MRGLFEAREIICITFIFGISLLLRAELPSSSLCYFLFERSSWSGVSWVLPVLCSKEWVTNKASIFGFIFFRYFSFFVLRRQRKKSIAKERTPALLKEILKLRNENFCSLRHSKFSFPRLKISNLIPSGHSPETPLLTQ